MYKKNILFWLKLHRMADDGGDDSLIPGASGGDGGDPPGDGGDPPADPPDDDDQSWFKSDKYKTVEDQAKAYNELEKKLGEKNEMIGAPEEAYELSFPEGVEGEFIDGDPLMEAFQAKAKELNLSQKAFDEILHTYLTQEAATLQRNRETEIKALGDNADQRLDALGKWGSANLDKDTFEVFRGVASTAAGVQLLEALMAKSRDHRISDTSGDHVAPAGLTAEKVREMANKVDEKTGQKLMSIDPAYRKKVNKAYEDLYGTEPKTTVIGG